MGRPAPARRAHERAPRAVDRLRAHERRGAALVGLSSARPLAATLAAGEPVFGVFAPKGTARERAARCLDAAPDFVFYDLETAPWDMDGLRDFATVLREGSAPPAVLLRIPPVGSVPADARRRIAEGMAAGADGLILPQVESPREIDVAVETLRSLGRRLWPGEAEADTLLVAQIESRAAVAAAGDILGADGVAVGLPGQKDLRASYAGDEDAVQEAVDAVRSVCHGLGLPSGVTAGSGDVADRLSQGFRFIIATAPEAVAAGRARQGA